MEHTSDCMQCEALMTDLMHSFVHASPSPSCGLIPSDLSPTAQGFLRGIEVNEGPSPGYT